MQGQVVLVGNSVIAAIGFTSLGNVPHQPLGQKVGLPL